jgi:chromosome segregation ATPase
MSKNMPVFIKVERYEDISKTITKIRQMLKDAKDSLDKISNLRGQEEREIEEWNAELEAVEERLTTIEETLLHPEQI